MEYRDFGFADADASRLPGFPPLDRVVTGMLDDHAEERRAACLTGGFFS